MHDLASHLLVSTPAVVAFIVWSYVLVMTIATIKQRVWVRKLPVQEPANGWPEVTLVVAARNEAAKIEASLKSLLAIDYPRLRLIAVNDRSTDATGAIMAAVADADPRLEIQTVSHLPEGWLGKTNAMQSGASQVKSPWILFTDGDVVFDPLVVKRVLSYAEANHIDHACMFPATEAHSSWEKMFLNYFSLLMSIRHSSWLVDNPHGTGHLGIGAFNLVRREAFNSIEGFRQLRLSVDDDVRLGEALKRHGYKLKLLFGGVEGVSVRWQDSFWGHIRGLEKNIYAGLEFNPLLVSGSLIGMWILGAGPFVGLFSSYEIIRLLAALTVIFVAIIIGSVQRQNRIAPYYALTLPLGVLFMTLAFLNSIYRTLRQGGINWREQFYSQALIKTHIQERSLWMRQAWSNTKKRRRSP